MNYENMDCEHCKFFEKEKCNNSLLSAKGKIIRRNGLLCEYWKEKTKSDNLAETEPKKTKEENLISQLWNLSIHAEQISIQLAKLALGMQEELKEK